MFLRVALTAYKGGRRPHNFQCQLSNLRQSIKGAYRFACLFKEGANLIEANSIDPIIAMPRPQTAGARAESELKQLANKKLVQSVDPVEKLRCYCLTRGANGILGLGR